MKKAAKIPIRIVFYREGNLWVAHCLEFDLVGNGDDKMAALRMLAEAIEIQLTATIQTGNIGNLFTQADGRYFLMFAKGKHIAKGKVEMTIRKLDHFELQPDEYREFTGEEAELQFA